MNTTTTETSAVRAYVCRQTTRGCENFGPSDLTYTDTLDWGARTVVSTVVGRSDGEWVNARTVRAMDAKCAAPDEVDALRRNGGWSRSA